MNTLKAFFLAESARAAGNRPKVFDWDRAAELIRDNRPSVASAGLGSDWEWTGGRIYEDGAPVGQDYTYTYLASIWATPEIDIDGEVMPCWRWVDNTPDWDADTYWPESALAILNAD